MENVIKSLKDLERELFEISKILARNELSLVCSNLNLSDISYLLNAQDNLWNAYVKVFSEGRYDKINKTLNHKHCKELLIRTDYFYNAFKMWCDIVSDCEVFEYSDVVSCRFIEWFSQICENSLYEVQILIDRIQASNDKKRI